MTTTSVPHASLDRRLGLGDAVFIGLGSMIGAGVFAAYAPAARAAGTGLLVGLALAAVVAYCNATASAQLAAAYPRAGGTYLYGREVLGAWWGYLAGWGFMVGKTASCAAMALTFAAYVAPAGWLRPVAAAVVVVLALGDVGRVHVYRWGDGGAHFHVWFVPRPLGRLDMSGPHLMAWEDVLPPASDEQIADAGRRIAAAL